ncbi:hypothetical protein GCM10023319_24230 [Nocardia iowensis]
MHLGPIEAEDLAPVGEFEAHLVAAHDVLEHLDHAGFAVVVQIPPAAGARGIVGDPLLGIEPLEVLALLLGDLLGEALHRVRVGGAVLVDVADESVLAVESQGRFPHGLHRAHVAQRPIARLLQRPLHRFRVQIGQLDTDLAARLIQRLALALTRQPGVPELLTLPREIRAHPRLGLVRLRTLHRCGHVAFGAGPLACHRRRGHRGPFLGGRVETGVQPEPLHLGVELLQLFLVDIAPVLVLATSTVQQRRRVVHLVADRAHDQVEEPLAVTAVELQHLQREERRIPGGIHRRQVQARLDPTADLTVQIGVLTRTERMLRNLLVPTVFQPFHQFPQLRLGSGWVRFGHAGRGQSVGGLHPPAAAAVGYQSQRQFLAVHVQIDAQWCVRPCGPALLHRVGEVGDRGRPVQRLLAQPREGVGVATRLQLRLAHTEQPRPGIPFGGNAIAEIHIGGMRQSAHRVIERLDRARPQQRPITLIDDRLGQLARSHLLGTQIQPASQPVPDRVHRLRTRYRIRSYRTLCARPVSDRFRSGRGHPVDRMVLTIAERAVVVEPHLARLRARCWRFEEAAGQRLAPDIAQLA